MPLSGETNDVISFSQSHLIFVKRAGNEDRHKSSNEFEFGPDRIIHFGVIRSLARNLFPHRLTMEKMMPPGFKTSTL